MLDAEHAGDGGAADVQVEQAHLVAPRRQGEGQLRRHRALAWGPAPRTSGM